VHSPLVTIGIPFLDAERTLLNAIRSVFAQSYANWELILIDDGSTDGGLELARSITDPRVRVYSDGKNLKLAARCNQIANLAKGKYVARLDADDLMHPERLQKQVSFMEEHRDVDVVGTGMFILDEQGHVIGKRHPRTQAKLSCRPSDVPVAHATVMGRTEWFRRNPYDQSLEKAQDMELWLRTVYHSCFANLPEPLYFYRELGSFSPEKYRRGWRCTRQVIRRHGPRLVGRLNARKEILKGYLKVAIYTGAYYCGLHRVLLRRRSLPISPEEKRAAEAALDRIRGQEVPLRSCSGVLQMRR
jgi:glycosyltransferase involved in cell wall biosynthesis